MSVRKIITYGHTTLSRRATEAQDVDAVVHALVEDLFETMYGARGIGLAATQVNELVRVAVVDPTTTDEPGTRALALINPTVVEYSGAEVFEEGCLSVPGVYADVQRPERILLRFVDRDGRQCEEEFEGRMARVIQHEIDHLDGRLFIDRLSKMRRALLTKKLREIRGDSSSSPSS
ncbi:MAG: peptide deformylase [Candidatus Eisenbacteria bacterium]